MSINCDVSAASTDHDGQQATVKMINAKELETVRLQLETGGWVLTYRGLVYFVACDASANLMTQCANFAQLREAQKARLLTVMSEPPQSPRKLTRCLRRHRLLDQLTKCLTPIGQLLACEDEELRQSLNDLAAGTDVRVAEIARRQLRAMQTNSGFSGVDGNERPFPLDCDLMPEGLRRAIHQDVGSRSRGFLLDGGANSTPSNNNNNKSAINNNASSNSSIDNHIPISAEDLYRPYLNDWTPFDTSITDPTEDEMQQEQQDAILLQSLLMKQRMLATTIGCLSWRQKQQRQQRLAVRLATRSALIGLKHSISVEPAKNYLELYVNMISRAVEFTSSHVRRWSYHLEGSWKTFKALAAD